MEAELRPFYDLIPVWLLITGTIVLFVLASEVGFRLAGWRKRDASAEEKGYAGVLLSALLGLLALLLAFSFTIVEERFVERKQLVVKEANAIGTAYLRASLMLEPQGERIQKLLRQYIGLRLEGSQPQQVAPELERSELLHDALWAETKQVAEGQRGSEIVALFVSSINDVIDVHEERVAVALYGRLPPPMLTTLYVVALLTMGVLGHSAGLARARSLLPTIATVAAIAIVVALVIEIDRPWQRLFTVSQQALADVQETMTRKY